MVLTRSDKARAVRRDAASASEQEPERESGDTGVSQGPRRDGPSSRTATSVATRSERGEGASLPYAPTLPAVGVPQGPRLDGPSSYAPSRYESRAERAEGASPTYAPTLRAPGVPQGPRLDGPSSLPPRRKPGTAFFAQFSPASPTGPNSGVRRDPARLAAASTPTATDAATDSAASTSRFQPRQEETSAADHAERDFTYPRTGERPLQTRTSSRRTSQASVRSLRLARAREDHLRAQEAQARLHVELAAAHISTLEAAAILEEEEEAILDQEEEDARTTFSEEEGEAEQSKRVGKWLNEHHNVVSVINNERDITAPPLMPPRDVSPARPEQLTLPAPAARLAVAAPAPEVAVPKSDIAELAAAITMATQQAKPGLSRRFYGELPTYNGSHLEWLSFKAAYGESAGCFSAAENTARLRRNLKGQAREAVENLLLHYTEPAEIMRTLEARFGRPEAIAATELDRLRALPRLTDTPRDICVFANKVSNVVAALKALNRVYYMYNPELTAATSDKLPPTLRHRWFEYAAAQAADEPDLLKLSRFLQREADLCSPYAQPEPAAAATARQDATAGKRKINTQRTYTTKTTGERACATCRSPGHGPPDCPDFKKANTNDRWDMAKRARLCFRCLRFRNNDHRCKYVKCDIDGCEYPHHGLLHQQKVKKSADAETVSSTWMSKLTPSAAYLKMAPVTIIGPAGEEKTWALLDDGSTVSLIEEGLAERVGAKGPIRSLFISAIGDHKIDATRSRQVPLTLRGHLGGSHEIILRTVHRLKLSPQVVRDEDLADCHHLRGIRSNDETGYAAPKILIGQDNWHLLVTHDMRTGRRDQPVASLTPLGWVIHGTHPGGRRQRVHFVAHAADTDDDMNEALRRYFALEGLTVAAQTPKSDPEQRALKILNDTARQLPDGRYETALLWRDECAVMPDNYDAALNRLVSVEKKLSKNPVLKVKYEQQMAALTQKEYAEVAPSTSNHRQWYLPHFGVVNPTKPDKLRIVHDAAAKTGGKCLNDFLLTGPDLLQSLPGILMRFRQHTVAVSADIAEMFMQVGVRKEDRDALRYLWREDPTQPPTVYRMKSVIFGATSSPATAIFVKNINAERHRARFPEAADAITRNHYMDDYLGSYRTPEGATRVAMQVRDIHKAGHFTLTKWTSNSEEVRRQLTDVEQPANVSLSGEPDTERVLGLVWRPAADVLAFNLDMARVPQAVMESSAPTKRQALRIVMSIYDPLGLASPVTARAKQLLQEVWRRGTAWDTRLDDDLCAHWSEWMGHLQRLRDISVPRCYPGYSDAVDLQLHTYVDASESAYSAALYWRAEMPDGEVRTSLVLAKARVAPLKLTSIPRLELQAAVMGSRMAAAVTEEHDRKPDSRVFWTDSATALTWLRTGSRSYRPFVAHRIAAVEENSALTEWRWVPTKDNVADDATRDVPQDFDRSHRWFAGPDFLRLHESLWPVARTPTAAKDTGEERCVTLTTGYNIGEATPSPERFSKWERYLRATARVLQFCQLCRRTRERAHYKRTRKNALSDPTWQRHKKNTPPSPTAAKPPQPNRTTTSFVEVDADTLRRAETLIWRLSQERAFGEERRDLQAQRPIARHSRLYKLSLRCDGELILLNSRIDNITGADNVTTAPPVLDGDRYETRLLIDSLHRKLHHAGPEATMGECRQYYWVIRLRPVTKMVLHACLPCRIRKDAPPRPSTGNHPISRLAHHQRAFTYTGLDYFGPYNITSGRSVIKYYVAIFTCLTTRAVHLEPTASLSTSSAVMALRRMIARRGTPTELWSDNGTNLRGADKELRQALDRATAAEASQRSISWRFVPPGAPFMGGAWERMVRAVKAALAATQQPRHPTVEVFGTLLAEAEFTVNSRPLTHVSVSADDPAPLTPNHFLLGGPARVSAPGTFDDSDLIGRAHWRASQRLADIFWSRWLREYLPELQHRREPHCRGPTVGLGDVVIIADNTLPRNTWPRGVVEATYPGTDDITRVVDVRTIGGLLRRPVKKLIVLQTSPAAHQTHCSATDGTARRENVRDD